VSCQACAKLRPEIIPNVPVNVNTFSADHAEVPPPAAPAPMSWARLLKRVFEIDMEHCSQCGGTLTIIAAIEHPPVITKILTHLGLPARAPPRAAASAFDGFQHLIPTDPRSHPVQPLTRPSPLAVPRPETTLRNIAPRAEDGPKMPRSQAEDSHTA
jgi:hypothetical protein